MQRSKDLNCLGDMGFGSLAKVLEPASLVKEINDELGKALKSYAKL
ncbi:MAG: hypothetical protein ACREO5_04545 [Candidatus Binatia bacterium]